MPKKVASVIIGGQAAIGSASTVSDYLEQQLPGFSKALQSLLSMPVVMGVELSPSPSTTPSPTKAPTPSPSVTPSPTKAPTPSPTSTPTPLSAYGLGKQLPEKFPTKGWTAKELAEFLGLANQQAINARRQRKTLGEIGFQAKLIDNQYRYFPAGKKRGRKPKVQG